MVNASERNLTDERQVPMHTNRRTLGYWAATGIISAALVAGASTQLARLPTSVERLQSLGYPLYVLTILGTWKLLAVAALLAPRIPRLKEWAYAGIFFDLTGAAASHAFSGDLAGATAPILLLLLAAASWALRPESRAWPGGTRVRRESQLREVFGGSMNPAP
jgi:hypothetical protein